MHFIKEFLIPFCFEASDNCSKQKDEAVTWFRHVHPRVTSDAWPLKWRPIEFVQWPGETVFVPGPKYLFQNISIIFESSSVRFSSIMEHNVVIGLGDGEDIIRKYPKVL